MRPWRAWVVGTAAALASVGAQAQVLRGGEPSFLSLGAGVYDVNDDSTAADFRAEYRSGWGFFDVVKPFVGLQGTSDGTVYGYFGLGVDLHLGDKLVLTPNAAVGLLDEGSGKDLGSPIEFRTGVEIAWRFENRSRLGLAFHHISNARISEKNPGTEVLSVIYSIPFDLIR
jgi:lipid A 3-O-deacylase